MNFKEKMPFFEKIEKITEIIYKHGLHEFDHQILEKEFEKLSKELKNRFLNEKKSDSQSSKG